MSSGRQVCTFVLDDMLFGVDVHEVQEVIRYQEMTEVPLSPPEITGLINLRGQIVVAIDLRRRLGIEARRDDALPMNVVVRLPDGPVAFLVDEIGDVVEVDESAFERSPETLCGEARELIHGVYKLDHGLLLLLHSERAAACPAVRTEVLA